MRSILFYQTIILWGVFLGIGSASPILGYWQNIADENHFVGFERNSFIQKTSEKEFRQFVVKHYSDRAIILPNLGPALRGGKVISYEMDGEHLKIQRHGFLENDTLSKNGFHTFKRLPKKPTVLVLKPLKVAFATRPSSASVKRISDELIARMERDQKARRTNYSQEDQRAQSEDHRWLRSQIAQVGWIDLKRFPVSAAQSAFLIAQHSMDMRLRLAAQKGLQEDFRNGSPAQAMLAILTDRNSLYSEGVQKYGTHFYQTKDKKVVFLPFKDRGNIERDRRSLKMGSFKKYLEQIRSAYPNHQIEFLETVYAKN